MVFAICEISCNAQFSLSAIYILVTEVMEGQDGWRGGNERVEDWGGGGGAGGGAGAGIVGGADRAGGPCEN